MALGAGFGNNPSFTTTATAGSDIYELPENAALHPAQLPAAITLRALLGLAPRLAAHTAALRTIFYMPDLDFILASKDRLFKGNGEVIAKVSSPLRSSFGCGSRSSEKGIEDIAKATEDIEAFKAFAKTLTSMPEAVVGCPLIGVREHFISFIKLFELILSPIIPSSVGMVLEGKFTECPLYLIL